ncbi:hypothetical protein GY21_20350, partial [Cryobacterium roopkundense]
MIEITMPRLSDTMEEGAIVIWHKQPGDRVEVGDLLVEIETDKATMEYEAYEAGILSEYLVPEGQLAKIGAPIALLDDGTPSEASAPAAPPEAAVEPALGEPTVPIPVPETGERMFASPLVRKLARENHLDLSHVRGTGPGGRIIRADTVDLLSSSADAAASATPALVEPAGSAAPAAPVLAAPSAHAPAPTDKRAPESVPLSSLRRVVARRLGESARSIPHFFVTAAADAENLMLLRAELNEQLVAAGRPKVSVNDLLIRASALA